MSLLSSFFSRAFRFALVTGAAGCAAGLCPGLFGQTAVPSALDGFIPNVGGVVNAVVLAPDPKIAGQTDLLVAGNFTQLQPKGTTTGFTCWNIVRLMPNGSPDTTFNPNVNGQIFAVVVQPDGSIVIGGSFTSVVGATVAGLNPITNKSTVDTNVYVRNNIARLNPNGTVDPTFDPEATGTFSAEVQALALEPNGEILVGGAFNYFQPNGAGVKTTRNHIAMLNPDGTVDPNFNPNASAAVLAIALQPDGNVLVGGGFTTIDGTPRNHIARLNVGSDNTVTIDSFNPDPNLSVSAITLQPDGRILVGGNFTSFQPNGTASIVSPNLARLNADGSLDSTFQILDPSGPVNAIALQPDGRILIGGSFIQIDPVSTGVSQAAQFLARVNPDGTPDDNFESNVGINGVVNTIALQPDGEIVVGGNFNNISGAGAAVPCDNVARFDTNGLPDITFDPSENGIILAVANQASSGDLILGGSFTSIGGVASRFIARISPAGAIDTSFGPGGNVGVNGEVVSIVVEPDSTILIAGNFTSVQGVARNGLARLQADGTLDMQFDPNPAGGGVAAMVVEPGANQILLGGFFTSLQPNHATASTPRQFIARVNADGTLDTSFDPEADSPVNTIALEGSQILVGGSFTSFKPGGATNINANIITIATAARLNSDGTVDQNFNPGPGGVVNSIAVQADGNILIGGNFIELAPQGNSGQPIAENYLARVTPKNGNVDPTFSTPNLNSEVNSIRVAPNGQIYISGFFSASSAPGSLYGAFAGNYFVRLNKDGSTDGAFDLSLNAPVDGYALQSDGSLYLGGDFTIVDGTLANLIVHVTGVADPSGSPPAGSLVSSFALSSAGVTGSTVRAFALGPNGAVIVGGDFASGIGGGVSSNLVRINLGGAPDGGFTPNANGPVNAVVTLDSGTPITTLLSGLTWLNSDGTQRKIGFNPPTGFQITGTVETVVVDPNNQYIYVGGAFTNSAVAPVGEDLIRFRYADGTLDQSFTPNPDGPVQAIAVQSNGQILIGGAFTTFQAVGSSTVVTRQFIARLNPDGTVDSGFNPTANSAVDAIAIQPTDGKILIGGGFTTLQPNGVNTATAELNLARLNTDGTLDATFSPNPSAQVTTIVVQTDGKILIGGDFTSVQPQGTSTAVVRNNIARINSNGSLDLSFDPEANGGVNAILPLANGQILIGGAFTTLSPGAATETPTALVNTYERNFFARINSSDGSVDQNFNPSPNGSVNSISLAPDGNSVYIGGFFNLLQPNTALNPTPRNFIAQIYLGGALDGTVVGGFDPQLNSGLIDVLAQPDGSLILAGNFTTIDPQGIILVGGQFHSPDGTTPSIGEVAVNYLALLRNDGTAVATFAPTPNGAVDALAVQTNGQILAGGAFTTLQPIGAASATAAGYIARINGDGSLDAAFGTHASTNGEVEAVALQGNGQILIGGHFTQVDGQPENYVARLNADGTLDTTFASNVNGAVGAIAVQADGNILIAGAFTSVGGPGGQSYLARLLATGAMDPSFRPVITGSGSAVGVNSIVVEANGGTGTAGPLTPTFTLTHGGVAVTAGASQNLRILIGGTFTSVTGTPLNNLAELTGDGNVVTSFNPGADNTVDALLLQSDGKLFVGGAFGNLGGQTRFRLGRLEDTSSPSQALGVSTDLTAAVFQCNGGPELSEVDFQVSTDDSTWTNLGFGTRIGSSSDWILTGLSLPANELFYIRTFGVAATSQNSSSGLALFVASFPAISPILTSPVVGSSTAINVVANQPFFYAIAATNSPTSFSANAPLPAGLALNQSTGVISGTPTQIGTFDVGIQEMNAAGTSSVATLVFTVGTASTAAPVLPAMRLTSVSTLSNVTSAAPLIAGIYIGGNGPKTVLLRGAGPSLASYGVSNPLSNPVLHLYNSSGKQILTSGSWGGNSTLAEIFSDLGAFPFASDNADAAVVTTLAPGGYTLQVADGAGTGGTALAEVYDADDNPLSLPQRIVALSGRAVVGPNNILIGGLYIQGPGMKRVLVRGVGPALAAFGVANPLPKPYLQIFSRQTVIAANQGWGTPLTVSSAYPAASVLDIAAAEVSAYTYAFPTGSADTAVVLMLPPGGYTAQISSGDGQSGTALFEVYELP